jgi:hypothetical protein
MSHYNFKKITVVPTAKVNIQTKNKFLKIKE